MRCDNCEFKCFDESENHYVCGIFGYDDDCKYISENSKGEEGCKYTKKYLNKINNRQMREEAEGYGSLNEACQSALNKPTGSK